MFQPKLRAQQNKAVRCIVLSDVTHLVKCRPDYAHEKVVNGGRGEKSHFPHDKVSHFCALRD